MIQLEIVSLIGIGLGVLLSIASVLLPISLAYLKQENVVKLGGQVQPLQNENKHINLEGENMKRVPQVLEQIHKKEEKSEKSEREALSLFLAHQ